MLDSMLALSFAVQANRGVYAVLLGSGISSAAGVPTGWNVTLDLIRKLAAVAGENCEPEPDVWYAGKYGGPPDYSELLRALAKTPAERQHLLRAYFEPTAEERERGMKSPTTAHRAIASLVADGFVRVIVTTNFDRLMETALAEAGVTPTVIKTPGDVDGAIPLAHTRCCLVKLHGDYLDSRLRNTEDELSRYPAKFKTLLNRILDEFGLIVCGWSATWDQALRASIASAKSRRFSMFWAAHGELTDAAKQLIQVRSGQVIPIDGADSFFTRVVESVKSIEEFGRPHPLSSALAVASLKRYLSEPKFRIQLHDLVNGEVDRVVDRVAGPEFAVQGSPRLTSDIVTKRFRAYEAACSVLAAMGPVAGYWASDDQADLWGAVLKRLAVDREQSGLVFWLELQRYPAVLVLYALGMGAVAGGQLSFVGKMLAVPLPDRTGSAAAASSLAPLRLLRTEYDKAKLLEGMDRRTFALSDWLHDVLRPGLIDVVRDPDVYTETFDHFEVLLALACAFQENQTVEAYFAPLGAFTYRPSSTARVLAAIRRSIDTDVDASPYVTSHIFGASAAACRASVDALEQFANQFARRRW
jgi:hypothetical protein